ncbi:MAG: phenylalanine--tRNA ligase subunit alpha, partial [Firmicutes bacterium]|nr:phenylalanine--tRNA ligase subunit alpha [Bacillota bacterium]
MKEKLEILLQEGKEKILAAKTEAELQEIKASLLGKKGSVTEMMKELPKLAPEDRREFGQAVNKVKSELGELVDAHREALLLKSAEIPADFDCTGPGIMPPGGALHPITQMCYDLNDAFRSMGFEIFQGDDITSELSAFDT